MHILPNQAEQNARQEVHRSEAELAERDLRMREAQIAAADHRAVTTAERRLDCGSSKFFELFEGYIEADGDPAASSLDDKQWREVGRYVHKRDRLYTDGVEVLDLDDAAFEAGTLKNKSYTGTSIAASTEDFNELLEALPVTRLAKSLELSAESDGEAGNEIAIPISAVVCFGKAIPRSQQSYFSVLRSSH